MLLTLTEPYMPKGSQKVKRSSHPPWVCSKPLSHNPADVWVINSAPKTTMGQEERVETGFYPPPSPCLIFRKLGIGME